jgi:hypothetical protein
MDDFHGNCLKLRHTVPESKAHDMVVYEQKHHSNKMKATLHFTILVKFIFTLAKCQQHYCREI